ncbi:Helix-turn-helix [Sulfobacillus thermosulfidooxidans DSM 9293]|uniref:Helix-turn-helix n=1 Tax=Sulfobacillus thermosulfidooxidans (strain DSM 9293 / VKM B-1269 / AT-1) TaxID=929705 RepID=A0A1W1W6Y9_SULTA|nr:helix-turn-helix transcriptional regulator [Sulfobacillus thermosulfidooxidans]SMC02071.1 Helix-turn-helix [Sulfobacillus thermosulfidooxidans DSM 9293]
MVLRQLRQAHHLTQKELADSVGVSQSYLARIERGERQGNVQIYRRLASILQVPIERILPPDNSEKGR